MTAPITAPVTQRVLGTITMLNGPGRPAFTEADLRTAVDIGRRAGVLNEGVFGAILLMVMATTFVAPPALKSLFGSPPADGPS